MGLSFLFKRVFSAVWIIAFATTIYADELDVYIETSTGQTEFCVGASISMVARDFFETESITGHKWESPDGDKYLESRDHFAVFRPSEPGRYKIIYTATDENGNQSRAEIQLDISELPLADVEKSRGFFTRIRGKSFPVVLTASENDSKNQYQWFKDNQVIENADSHRIKVEERGRYRLMVTSSEGCRGYSTAFFIE